MNSDDRNEVQMLATMGVLLNGYSKSFRNDFSEQSQMQRFQEYWMIIGDSSAEVGLDKVKQVMQIFGKAVDDANEVLKGTSLLGHQLPPVARMVKP